MFRLLRAVGIAALIAIPVLIVVSLVQDRLKFQADNKKYPNPKRGANIASRPQPPPLPPAIDPAEVARITAHGKPQHAQGWKKDFSWAEIETKLETLRHERPQRPQALDDLQTWYSLLTQPAFTESNDYAEHFEKMTAWGDEIPTSPTALVVLANIQMAYAWEARGGGFAFTVSPEGWELFQKRIAAARLLVEQAVEKGPADGQAYSVLVSVAKAEGWPKEKTYAVVGEGRKKDPSYFPIYMAMAEYLLPRWHGEPGDIEEFAAEVVKTVSGDDGLDAYGHIAFMTNQFEPERLCFGHYDRNLLGQAAEVLVMRYPQAQNLVPFAALCALASQNHKIARRIYAFLPPGHQEAPRVPGWRLRRSEFERWCNARDIPSGETDWIWGSYATYGNIAFDPDSRFIWCGRHQSATPVTLLDLKDHETALGLEGPGGQINDLAFDDGKKWIAASTLSSEFKGWVLWNIKNPEEPIVQPTDEICQAIAISPTASQLAIATQTKVRTFNVETRAEGPEMELKEHIHFLNYSPDGKLLGINASVWDATAGKKLYDYRGNPMIAFDEQDRPLAPYSISKPGSSLFPLYRYLSDGQSHETLIEDLGQHSSVMALSFDRKLLAVAEQNTDSNAEGIKVFDLSTGKPKKRFGGHWQHIGSLAFSPDSKKLASIALMGGVIKIWSLEDNPASADH